jgi:UDP-N-acetylmuramoylalanine--D-glutamate ligase
MMRDAPRTVFRETDLRGKTVLILGLGDTGLSVARWVTHRGGTPRVADTRAEPPRKKDYAGELHTGPFKASLLKDVALICVSPGLPRSEPLLQQRHIPVVGDIELFAWENKAKVIAVTGTNGKSTVTALTGHLLRTAGVDCEVAGNIGPAVLEACLERKTPPAAWVLELSSYQLETTWSLNPDAAAMLNLSEDHLDRYRDLGEYADAKARIFQGSGVQVLNRDDPYSCGMAIAERARMTFGLGEPGPAWDWGLRNDELVQGERAFFARRDLPVHGAHNVANALAACALACSFGVSHEKLAEGLRTFKGLRHRLERVAVRDGVDWYDDSKGTNVGATLAALSGLGKKVVVILGGDGKGQDFSPLKEAVREFASHVLLIGRDAPLIEKAVGGERCDTLEEAVSRAAKLAKPGEAVLLSPACASFDMFRDYRHRGEVFAAAVKALPATEGPSS